MIPKTHKAVVLVHGLWMQSWSMGSIAKFLKDRGYNTYQFGYKTTTKPFEFNVQKLQAYVNSRQEETVHIVAHSLGGILSMRSLPGIRKKGKLVMLGSPINGAHAAESMEKRKWTSNMLKHAEEPLRNGVVNPKALRSSMMIAGVSGHLGVSRIVTKLPKPNDGTVALTSTQADWIDNHLIKEVNHFTMLFKTDIKKTIFNYLKEEPHD